MKPAREFDRTVLYPHLVRGDDFVDDRTLMFPYGVPRMGGLWESQSEPEGGRTHPAEIALERAQRRLDNLRAVLGPDFGRESDDGPWAA